MDATITVGVEDVERRLLLAGCAAGLSEDAGDRLAELLADPPEQGAGDRFERLATKHRVVPVLVRRVGAPSAWTSVWERLGRRSEEIWRRNEEFSSELVAICTAAEEAGVPILVRKGVPLAVLLHGDVGAREMDDIDLLVRRSDAVALRSVLESVGYFYGRSSHDGGTHRRWDRRTEIGWTAAGLELPGFTRPGIEGPIRISLVAAVFDRRCRESVDIDDLFERSTWATLGGSAIPVLSEPDCLVDLCAHFVKDAKSIDQARAGADLLLHRFCDVAYAARRIHDAGRWDEFLEIVGDDGLAAPTWFALAAVDEVFPGYLPAGAFSALAPVDREYLHRYGEIEGRPARWRSSSVADRLFDEARRAEVV